MTTTEQTLAYVRSLSAIVSPLESRSEISEHGGGPSIVSVALAALPVALGSIFWASSTRGTQEKVDALMDTVSRSLAETAGQSTSPEEGRQSASAEESGQSTSSEENR